ncbi:hypothetical protein NLJ89_g4208 [Agrocybe chaxingu]|uniref:Uncharacterized protein n=1 Tax=Agrocybe chaxingu TaxID=84603 RepID=A0A9W8K3R6_9AGAR|nr:hypothetical protein NLJ89_g4208 [Agrocybe chaxingu]
MAPGGDLELRLIVRYEGLKATQYFAKYTPESEKVFRDDLQALKLPHPKRENTNLLSHGSVECFWESVQKDGVLHQHLVYKALPPDKGNQRILAENLKNLSIAKLTLKQLYDSFPFFLSVSSNFLLRDPRNPNNSAAMRRQNPPSRPSSSITKKPSPLARSQSSAANPRLPPRPTPPAANAPPKRRPEDVFRTSANPYSLILDDAFPRRPSTPNPYCTMSPSGVPDITTRFPPATRPASDWASSSRSASSQSGPSSLKRPHAALSNVQQGQSSSSSKSLSSEAEWEYWHQFDAAMSNMPQDHGWNPPPGSTCNTDRASERPTKVAKTHEGPFELPKKPAPGVPLPNRVPLSVLMSSLPPASTKLPKQSLDKLPPSQHAGPVKTQASGPRPSRAVSSGPVPKVPIPSAPSWLRADRVDDRRITSQRKPSSGAVPSTSTVVPVPTQKPAPSAPSTSTPPHVPASTSTSTARMNMVRTHGGPLPSRPPLRPSAQLTREQTQKITSAAATGVVAQSTPSTFKATPASASSSQSLTVPASSSDARGESSPMPGFAASSTVSSGADPAPLKPPVVDLHHKRPHIEQADARALALKMATKAHEPPAPVQRTTAAPSSGSAPSRSVVPIQPVASARIATTSKPALTVRLQQNSPIAKPPTSPAKTIAPPTPVSLTKPTPPLTALDSAASDASMSIRVKEEPIEVQMLAPWTSPIESSAPIYIKEEVDTTSSLFLDSTPAEKRTRPSRFAQLVEPSPLPTPPPSAEPLHPTQTPPTTATTTPKRTSRFADKTIVQQSGPVAGPSGATTNLGESVAQSSVVITVPPSPPISSTSPPTDPENQPLPALLNNQIPDRYTHEHTHTYESYEHEHKNGADEDTMARGTATRTSKPYGSHQNNNHRREREDSATRIQSLTRESWSIKREITAALEREKDVIAELKSLDSKSVPAPTRLWDTKDDARIHDLRNRLNSAEGELEEEKRRAWVMDRALEEERELRFCGRTRAAGCHPTIEELERELKQEREKRQRSGGRDYGYRRECREPFVVPSLVDAYLQISQLTSRALKAAAERKAAEKAGVPTAGGSDASGSGAAGGSLMTGWTSTSSGCTVMATVLTTDPSAQANPKLPTEDMDLSDS